MARSALIFAAIALVLLAGGILLARLGEGSVAVLTVGLVMAGLGAILLAGIVFYEVGRSEDRDRARHPFG